MRGPPVIGHQAIAASAGSGKTFQLAHRYLRLLAAGVGPDRIIALTFSRKAAGEIFDSIINYLCQAALSSDEAARTAERLGMPGLVRQDFVRMLRQVLDSLPLLHVGTLDSFIVGVIGTFPMELGISANLRLMENASPEALAARQQVLGRILDPRHLDTGTQREFLEAFRQATFGREEKGLERSLDIFLGEYEAVYQALAEERAWGRREVIWPDGSPWLGSSDDAAAAVDDMDEAARELESLLERESLSDRVIQRWRDFIAGVCAFGPGSPVSGEIEYLFKKLTEDVEGLRRGSAVIGIDRARIELSPEWCRPALALVTHVMKKELGAAMHKTQGLYRVLSRYEQLYDRVMRRKGVLTFTDAQYLLTGANGYRGGGVSISRAPSQESRLYIDYRLDCKLDHWLLDEFQDTSDLQWEVLRNLVDEIVQDSSGERSFFCVGDVKQAIYGWRGGNARLLGSILEQYDSVIEDVPLSTSFRSCQPVIDTVNLVFGQLEESGLRRATIDEWRRAWQEHRCERGMVPDTGFVALLEPECQGGDFKPEDQDRYRLVAHLLREIEPLKRGLSVGVLVRRNESGGDIVDFLRGQCPDMNVVHEGNAPIGDNPVVALMLSLVQFAAHPGDSLAWRHLQMSPLRHYIAERGLDRDSLSPALLRQIQTDGFRTLVRLWGERLERAQPLDDFGRKRLNDLAAAAGEFDRTEGHDCNAFLRFIENYQARQLAAEEAVRVMTVHQSKGLGFDIVILPDLQSGNLNGGGRLGLTVGREPETGLPAWALEMPRRLIAERDSVLAREVADADDRECFEQLCVLYVAMTRAKQGLYIVTSFPGKSSAALTPGALVKRQLVGDHKPTAGGTMELAGEDFMCLYQAGDPDWYWERGVGGWAVEPAGVAELPADFARQPSQRRRLVRVSPSEQHIEQRAEMLFAPGRAESGDIGAAVHELFQKIVWVDEETDVEQLIRDWEETGRFPDRIRRAAAEQFHQALDAADIRQALSRPEGKVELWRERRFQVVLDNRWVTGMFDRVVVVRDAGSRPVAATIIDFKSDELPPNTTLAGHAERYRPQLSLYAAALSHMLQLDPSRIELRLAFTRLGRVRVLS